MSATGTGPYSLPQGIEIDAQNHQAVPRKIGAFDTEFIIKGATSNGLQAQVIFFQNATTFTVTPTAANGLTASKVYGRDTNITSRTGGMAKGERLYTYGLTGKISAPGWPLASTANLLWFDAVRSIWELVDLNFKLGSDEFVRIQGRDCPCHAPKAPFVATTAGATTILTEDLSSEGMYDLTVAGDPYVLDQQEDFRIELNINPNGSSWIGSVVSASPTQSPVDTAVTMRLEGIRLRAVRQ